MPRRDACGPCSRRLEFAARPLGEGPGSDVTEHVVRDAQLSPGVGSAVLAAQPFPVQQVGPSEVRPHARSTEPLDRLAVQGIGDLPLTHLSTDRPGCREPSRYRRPAPCRRSAQRRGRVHGSAQRTEASTSSTVDWRERPSRPARFSQPRGGRIRLRVPAEAVVEHAAAHAWPSPPAFPSQAASSGAAAIACRASRPPRPSRARRPARCRWARNCCRSPLRSSSPPRPESRHRRDHRRRRGSTDEAGARTAAPTGLPSPVRGRPVAPRARASSRSPRAVRQGGMREGASRAFFGGPVGANAESLERAPPRRLTPVVRGLAVQKEIVACGSAAGLGVARMAWAASTIRALALWQPAGGEGRVDRVPVRLTGEPGVERLQSSGRFEQQRQAVAGAAGGEHDRAAQQRRPCGSEAVERDPARPRAQFSRGVERAGLVFGVCSRQRPGSTARGVGRQLVRPGRGRPPPRRLRRVPAHGPPNAPARRPPPRRVSPSHAPGATPDGPDRAVGVGLVRQSSVHLAQVVRACRAIGRRTHQRVAEARPGTEGDQSRRLGPSRPRPRRFPAARPPA